MTSSQQLLLLCSLMASLSSTLDAQGDPTKAVLERVDIQLQPSNELRVILEPRERTTLSAEVDSVVEKIHFHLGEDFCSEDILIELEDDSYDATMRKAAALAEKAEVEYQVRQELLKEDVASKLEVAEAKAAAKGSQADLDLAAQRVKECTIQAPYNGKVVSVLVDEYEIIRAGQPLMEVVDDSVLIARILLPSKMLPDIQKGQIISIAITELAENVQASIVRIGSVIDPSSSMVKVEAEIDNKKGLIKAGMQGSVNITAKEKTNP